MGGTGGAKEAAFSLEDAARAGESTARQVGGQDPIERRLSRVEMLAHRAVGVEFPKTGCLRPGTAKGIQRLCSREVQQRRGCRRGAECGGRAGRMPESVVARVDGLAYSQRRFVADRDSEQEPLSINVLALRYCER